jgi:hypothetical protein
MASSQNFFVWFCGVLICQRGLIPYRTKSCGWYLLLVTSIPDYVSTCYMSPPSRTTLVLVTCHLHPGLHWYLLHVASIPDYIGNCYLSLVTSIPDYIGTCYLSPPSRTTVVLYLSPPARTTVVLITCRLQPRLQWNMLLVASSPVYSGTCCCVNRFLFRSQLQHKINQNHNLSFHIVALVHLCFFVNKMPLMNIRTCFLYCEIFPWFFYY